MVRRQQWCETVGRRKRMADEREIGCQVCRVETKTKAGGKGVLIKREKRESMAGWEMKEKSRWAKNELVIKAGQGEETGGARITETSW